MEVSKKSKTSAYVKQCWTQENPKDNKTKSNSVVSCSLFPVSWIILPVAKILWFHQGKVYAPLILCHVMQWVDKFHFIVVKYKPRRYKRYIYGLPWHSCINKIQTCSERASSQDSEVRGRRPVSPETRDLMVAPSPLPWAPALAVARPGWASRHFWYLSCNNKIDMENYPQSRWFLN